MVSIPFRVHPQNSEKGQRVCCQLIVRKNSRITLRVVNAFRNEGCLWQAITRRTLDLFANQPLVARVSKGLFKEGSIAIFPSVEPEVDGKS